MKSFPTIRVLIAIGAICVCLWMMWLSVRVALSKIFITHAVKAANLAAADQSIAWAETDADAHLARAQVLRFSSAMTQALPELERAVSLRPRDYYLWLALGLTRDELEDPAGALAAFNEAVRLAPFYGQSLWQRGNLLLRMRRYEEAFSDLRRAAQSNPTLVPTLIDLAWGFSNGKPKVAEQLAGINNNSGRLAFALFLAQHNNPTEAVAQFRSAGLAPPEAKSELVKRLINANAFREALEVWQDEAPLLGKGHLVSSIYDGGFEGPMKLGELGFGWRIPRELNGVSMSLDTEKRYDGLKSLLLDFGGDPTSGVAPLSQLILVEPSSTYRVNFSARTEDVVTGGLPLVLVSEATPPRNKLGQSRPLPHGTSDWQVVSFEFMTASTTRAVVVSLQRENCTSSPCPIFGSVWLDSFSIQQIK